MGRQGRRHLDSEVLARSAWEALSRIQKVDSYAARMVARLPCELLVRAREGDILLDPFCGSGSILGAASAMGLRAIGIDLNPLAAILSHLKFGAYNLEAVRDLTCSAVEDAMARKSDGQPVATAPINLNYWFNRRTLAFLQRCTAHIAGSSAAAQAERDAAIGIIACVVRRCSRADHRGPKPFVSRSVRGLPAPTSFDARRLILRKLMEVERRVADWRAAFPGTVPPKLVVGDARGRLPSCNLVVTSPPYLCAQDYYRSTKLELAVTGTFPEMGPIAFSHRLIGSDRGPAGDEEASVGVGAESAHLVEAITNIRTESKRHAALAARYFRDVFCVLRNIRRALKPGGSAVLVVGDSCMRDVPVRTSEIIVDLAAAAGLRMTARRSDKIRNRRVPPQRRFHSSVIELEHILTFVQA